MKTILVPTDFSEPAKNAIEYAVKLAKEFHMNLQLLHLFHVPIPPPMDIPVDIHTSEMIQKQKEAVLKKEAEAIHKKYGVKVNYSVKINFAVDGILDEKADLIVIGMQGANNLSDVLMGSVTTSVLRESKIPVFVIPEKTKFKKPKKIVFACDFDYQKNTNTYETLKGFAEKFDSKICVLNVSKNKQLEIAEETHASKQLEKSLTNIEHEYFFHDNENLVEEINEFVADQKADIVAVIPHKYNIIENLFHKSISKKLAFYTQVPLFVIPDHHKSIAAFFI
jgi:nucleotide-binding universal stress UspA family protein